jgi:PQQ enzyme repeat
MIKWATMSRHRLSRIALVAAMIAGLAPVQAADVTTYHNSPSRDGLSIIPGLTWSHAAQVKFDTNFVATVNGSIRGQPLYWTPPGGGTARVIVATEQNTVYALDANTGAQVWATALGQPVPLSMLPCGNIDPMGITGTPVIDPATNVVYVAALRLVGGQPRHQVYGIDLGTGKQMPGWPVDVATGLAAIGKSFAIAPQGQRSALTLVNGRLIVAYAGHFGDCGTYRGWAVGLDTAKPGVFGGWATRAQGGGSWGQSGIAFDGTSMFITTGNSRTFPQSGPQPSWDDSEAVIRLEPSLANTTKSADYFAPSNWLDLNASDTDLGGTSAIPIDIPNGTAQPVQRVLALGKDGNAYLLDRANLGGVGGQIAVAGVADSRIITAAATYPGSASARVAFTIPNGNGVQCPSGQSGNLVMLSVTASAINLAWCTAFSGSGSPIITTTDGKSDPIVWVVGANGDGQLHGFRGTDGVSVYASGSKTLGGLRSYQTLTAVPGHFYIAADNTVYAFSF